jgi:hypothetical protein
MRMCGILCFLIRVDKNYHRDDAACYRRRRRRRRRRLLLTKR